MTDIEVLQQMVKDRSKLVLENRDDNKKKVTLTESTQPKASITIHGIPEQAIVIKADSFRSPDTVFNGSHGECKRADFVIIADTGKKKVILCIEIKATKDSTKEIIQQLIGARCFVAYCQEIGREFWQQQDFLKGYVYRFISIGHIGIDKRRTRISRESGKHDSPKRMLKIDWPHYLEFNHLAGTN